MLAVTSVGIQIQVMIDLCHIDLDGLVMPVEWAFGVIVIVFQSDWLL